MFLLLLLYLLSFPSFHYFLFIFCTKLCCIINCMLQFLLFFSPSPPPSHIFSLSPHSILYLYPYIFHPSHFSLSDLSQYRPAKYYACHMIFTSAASLFSHPSPIIIHSAGLWEIRTYTAVNPPKHQGLKTVAWQGLCHPPLAAVYVLCSFPACMEQQKRKTAEGDKDII